MGFGPLVGTDLDDEEIYDMVTPIPMPGKPRFPPGLRICLGGLLLKKLGLDVADCKVGDLLDGRFFAGITSIHQEGDDTRVELIIEKMAVENEMTEVEDEED
jgi:hypothetical protein